MNRAYLGNLRFHQANHSLHIHNDRGEKRLYFHSKEAHVFGFYHAVGLLHLCILGFNLTAQFLSFRKYLALLILDRLLMRFRYNSDRVRFTLCARPIAAVTERIGLAFVNIKVIRRLLIFLYVFLTLPSFAIAHMARRTAHAVCMNISVWRSRCVNF